MSTTEDYLIDTADQCVKLAKAGRAMAEQLEAMSNNLLAKAVELDTARQRDEKRTGDEKSAASERLERTRKAARK